jgi:hypothetical protein
MLGYVIAIVAEENANGILEWWTGEILKRMERIGYETRLLDMQKPDFAKTLVALLRERKPTFGFSFQGMGGHIKVDGTNLWERLDIPFFTYMGDSPSHNPLNHWFEARRTYLLYSCRDFLDFYRDYIKGPTLALLHPQAFPDNPHADETAWADREFDIVYMKSGFDPGRYTRYWEDYPRRIRSILWDASKVALAGADQTIAEICADRFRAESIVWAERSELFCAAASTVDLYVRATRATKMARALMRFPARIYGDGWDFLDKTDSRASFHGTVHAADLPRLYADARILANVSPSTRYAVHDRVLAGFQAKCAVLSDLTPFARAEFADCPAYLGVNPDSPDFDDQVSERLRLPHDFADSIEASHRTVSKRFSFDDFVRQLLEMQEMDRFVMACKSRRSH